MRKMSCEHQRDEEFVFLLADGSAKSSGKDYDFQEPTLRRESTVKRESQEEFQLEETKDDEGINKDFWAHAEIIFEPRSSTNVPREESFLIFNIFNILNETLPRRRIRYGGKNGEEPKHLRQNKLNYIDLAWKGRNSVLYYNFAHELILMKRSQESSSPYFL